MIKKLLKTALFYLVTSFFINKSYASFELNVMIGRTFNNSIGSFTTREETFSQNANTGAVKQLHSANTTAQLGNNPDNSTIAGFGASYFFSKYFGLNLDCDDTSYSVNHGDIILSDSAAPNPFPAFTLTLFSIRPSIGLKFDHREQTYYAALGYAFGFGSLDNANFLPMYGMGGSTHVRLDGPFIKLGVSTKLSDRFKIGLEYNFTDYNIRDNNQRFRSFNRGFIGSSKHHYIGLRFIFILSN